MCTSSRLATLVAARRHPHSADWYRMGLERAMARGWERERESDQDEGEAAERFRDVPARSSPYITPEGHVRLKAEYEQLWSVRRPQVVAALAAAAAEGDRSENAEYQYRKKELREIDRRVRYLQRRIPELTVAGRPSGGLDQVFFGAWVELVDDQEQHRRYRIVGPDETDATQGRISVDSPLARALLKRAAGEVVEAQLPGGTREFEILSVRYD